MQTQAITQSKPAVANQACLTVTAKVELSERELPEQELSEKKVSTNTESQKSKTNQTYDFVGIAG